MGSAEEAQKDGGGMGPKSKGKCGKNGKGGKQAAHGGTPGSPTASADSPGRSSPALDTGGQGWPSAVGAAAMSTPSDGRAGALWMNP